MILDLIKVFKHAQKNSVFEKHAKVFVVFRLLFEPVVNSDIFSGRDYSDSPGGGDIIEFRRGIILSGH